MPHPGSNQAEYVVAQCLPDHRWNLEGDIMLNRVGVHGAEQAQIPSASQQRGKIGWAQMFTPALTEKAVSRISLTWCPLKSLKKCAEAWIHLGQTSRD